MIILECLVVAFGVLFEGKTLYAFVAGGMLLAQMADDTVASDRAWGYERAILSIVLIFAA